MSIETESRIAFLKAELAETDYLCLKYTDGALSRGGVRTDPPAAGCVPSRDQRPARW